MIRKVSLTLSLLFLVGMVIPLDIPFFGKVLLPATAFSQGGPGLEDFALYSHQDSLFENIAISRDSIDIKKSASGGVSFHYHEYRPPIADPQTFSTAEDAPASITLTGSDPDDDALSYGGFSQPRHVNLTGSASDLNYMPDANDNGIDDFSVTINDGTAGAAAALVNIAVTAVKDAPAANPNNTDSAPDAVTNIANPWTVIVPDVVGPVCADAEGALTEAGLTAESISVKNGNTIPDDQVIIQTPAAGAAIAEAAAVDLVVSPGPESQLPTVSINASPEFINPGESATLSWTAIHGIGSVNPNDAETIQMIDQDPVSTTLTTDSDGITDALDADGDDQPDDLNGNGSFSDEVLGLADAQRYTPGATFWRVAVSHFTPWGLNWLRGFPGDAIAVNTKGKATLDSQCEGDCPVTVASNIEARSRIFHKDISISGTGITLHYASDRVKGYRQVITVPASGDTVPVSLKRIIARVEVAGRSFEQILDPLPDQMAKFVWDDRDHLGRPVHSPITAHVSVGFAYDAVYLAPGESDQSLAQAGSDIARIIAREEIISWKRSRIDVAPKTGGKNVLAEGWTISIHHQIAPSQPGLLFKGDGTTRTRDLPLISTIAGSGLMGYGGDGEPPTGEIPFAENSGLGHIFSGTGMHQKTYNLETGLTLRSFIYDEDDRLQAISDQFGNTIHIERDAAGLPLAIISPEGIRTELTIDADNHLTRITYADGNYYRFEYTPEGLMTAETQPAGNRFEQVYSQTGRLTDAYDDQGGHWNYQRTASVDGDILTRQTTGEANVMSYLDCTDSTGVFMSTITDPSGSQTLFTRSADGLSESKSSECGTERKLKYDTDSEYKFQFLKQITETSLSGLVKVVERDKSYPDTDADDVPDIVNTKIVLNGKTTTFAHYIPAAEKVATSPEGRTVIWLYDSDTLLTESVLIPGLYDTSYEYDAKGRLTRVNTHTRQTVLAYGPEGWLASVTDAEKRTTGYRYDALGRVTEISRTDGSYIDFEYDANGNLTVLTNPTGIAHGFGFNSVNHNSSYQTPLSGSYNYVYDKDRRLMQTNFPSGKTIINDYADPANPADKSRLRQIVSPEGNIDFTYQCGNRVGSISKGSESIAYSYDGELVTSERLSGTLNQSIEYTYNSDFDVAGSTYAGDTVTYSYDNDGLLTGAGNLTIWRNVDNGLAESVTGDALDFTRTFNGYGEVDAQATAVGNGNVASWSLTRDNNGRIISKTETVDGVTTRYEYTYDTVGRLLTVVKNGTLVEEYRYDFNGTRNYETNAVQGISGKSYSYSDGDHLLAAGSVSYGYDLDGYLTTKTDGSDVTNYNYSSRGELLRVSLPDGRTIEYVHDPLGRRIAKTVDGVVVEKYIWQGMTRLLAIYDGADNLLMRFDYADDRMPVAMDAKGVTYYLAYDQVGSLRLVADSAGNVIKSVEYDSFGTVLDDSNPVFAVPFGFAGGLHDRDTGLVRFGYRDYDPDIGRWTAKGPICFAGGDTDLYGYVLNDPINAVDPLGSINPVKMRVGFINSLLGATNMAESLDIMATGTPALPLTAGVSGAPVYAIGISKLTLGFANLNRGVRQMNEAYGESACQSSYTIP